MGTKKEKKKAFEAKSKFIQFIQRTSIFTHYIQNSRQSVNKHIFHKKL